MNITDTKIVLKAILMMQDVKKQKKRITPIIWGSQGIGKSDIAADLANELGFTRIADLRMGQQESGDLIGVPDKRFFCSMCNEDYGTAALSSFCAKPDCGGIIIGQTVWLLPSWFPKKDEKVLILLDELNRGRPDVLQSIFQLILDRQLHMIGRAHV